MNNKPHDLNVQNGDHKKLELLLSVTRNISKELEIDRLLMKIMDQVKKVLDCDRCSVFILDDERQELWSKVAHGASEIRFPSNKGIAGHVATTGEILNIRDAYADKRFNPNIDKQTGYITRNMLNAPLRNKKGEIIGVFQTLNKRGSAFNKDDEELLSAIAVLSAGQIENAQLYEEQIKTFDSFIETLASTIDARDPMTAGHSKRIALIADRIAIMSGFSDQDRRVLRISSLLHDYGKIAIREAVLTKETRLTQEEYEHIKDHPNYTRSILERINFTRELRNVPMIAASHHENLDGSGYPAGLKGDEIPELSKVIAVADVFDALTSKRHYRDRMDFRKVMDLIENDAGVKFEIKYVLALKEMKLNDVIWIINEGSDDLAPRDLDFLAEYSIQDLLDLYKEPGNRASDLFVKYYTQNEEQKET